MTGHDTPSRQPDWDFRPFVRRPGPDLRPFERKLVALSLVATVLCGLIGWGAGKLAARLVATTAVIVMDHTGHRPPRPPLPTSPFIK
jgi:hypothetical protein